MTPFSTPTADFYRVDISLVTPRIATDGWTLTIDGMVDRPITLSYDDLLAMPMIERDITLTCVSNEVGGPYVSTARWLGVPFSAIIERVGVRPGVDQVFSSSLDSGYTCSTPYQAVSDGRDAMIAVGMYGQPLPDERGFPARMLVPGLFGFVSATKWLRRIEFTTYAAREAYWTQRKWAVDAPILTQSRIDVPQSLATLSSERPVLAGVAWAQRRGIAKVEIRIDEGAWQEATLAADAGVDLWRQWSFRYDGPAGRHSAQVRATDVSGEVQPERRTKVFPSGATGWHQIQFVVE
jgi:DMSO/TMAO reductase YedYZ molybdopterin-dependent catalytic subunit